MEVFFFASLGIAILATVLSVTDRHEIAWPLLAFIAWFVTAGLSNSIEQTHVFVLPDGSTQTYTVTLSAGALGILFFAGIGLVFVAIFFNRIWAIYRETVRRR